ncbi:cell surface protein [Methanosarcina sp. MTP4]|uniref:right-handed parallel beta-helix repeat-containing protein n=1 Tax=Methanosarcina sp. MTP4 TaxID=1434100 RepID=UPI000615A4CC|nr:NosD domain-containing protein [Methanosarcina sp. MTP4]AKB23655.1 cell surface protein [Methanosarcina sp. MTP4]
MKLNKSLKAGILLALMLFLTAVPAACTEDAELPVYSLEQFNTGESDVSAEEACGCTTEHVGEILSGEEGVIVSAEVFASFGWPPLTVRVDGSGGGRFLTIGEALKHPLYDIILVAPGTYTENLVVDSQVTIRAESGNPEDTVIRAADPGAPVIHVTRRVLEIRGFTVEGANGSNDPEKSAGIFLDGARDCTLADNVFRDNTCAIFLKNSDDCRLRNNTVEVNGSYGIRLENAESNRLENNTIRDTAYSGILLQGTPGLELGDRSVLNSCRGIGLNFSDRNLLCNNTVSVNCRHGIELFFLNNYMMGGARGFDGSDKRQAWIRENASENNTLTGNFIGGYIKGINIPDEDRERIDAKRRKV